MGAPALTWFCSNGHIVEDVPHGYMTNDPTDCPYCDSKDFRYEMEWRDEDDYGPSNVPMIPVRLEKKRVTIKIPIYDVSKLFEERG